MRVDPEWLPRWRGCSLAFVFWTVGCSHAREKKKALSYCPDVVDVTAAVQEWTAHMSLGTFPAERIRESQEAVLRALLVVSEVAVRVARKLVLLSNHLVSVCDSQTSDKSMTTILLTVSVLQTGSCITGW